MRRIYTYGGRAATRNLTVADLQANKAAGVKMTQVSALDGVEAAACEAAGIDLITIADMDIANEVMHNTRLLRAGASFREFIDGRHVQEPGFGDQPYPCAAHGAGMADEWSVIGHSANHEDH